MTMKLQGPDNTGSFTCEGVTYEPDADGCIDVPGEVVTLALSHGFTPIDTDAPETATTTTDLGKLTKKQLLAFAKDAVDLELDPALTNKELIGQIEAALAASAV